jgi:MFS family permease
VAPRNVFSFTPSTDIAMVWLIVARAVQGVGSGSIMGLTQMVISDIVSLEERGKYAGFLGATVLTCPL